MEKKVDPSVSMIILNYNGLNYTVKCLESLLRIDYNNYRLIVVDNASDKNEAEEIERLFKQEITVIRNDRNYGYSEGNNTGIKFALERFDPKYVLIFNNDQVAHPDFLKELVAVAELAPSIGIAGPRTYYMDYPDILWGEGGRIYWYVGWNGLRRQGKKYKPKRYRYAEVDFVAGSCMLIKTEVIRKIGVLPTEYFLQWEDVDYCTAAKRAGFNIVYVPSAIVWHKVSASMNVIVREKKIEATFRGYRNRVMFFTKYLRGVNFAVFMLTFPLIMVPLLTFNYVFLHKDPKQAKWMLSGVTEGARIAWRRWKAKNSSI